MDKVSISDIQLDVPLRTGLYVSSTVISASTTGLYVSSRSDQHQRQVFSVETKFWH
ncbi:hypothetical protein Hdeb2414_s0007g00230591 [Helianthus debilis subsp. tardiflorus]